MDLTSMGEELRHCTRRRRRRRRCRRRRSGEDHISGLPDELLHEILVRLGSTRAAARTGVLSRRWRHLWISLPELVLDINADAPPPPASFLDTVDGALAGHSAPALDLLSITLSRGSRKDDYDSHIPPERVAPWLRFAAERVVGTLKLHVPTHRRMWLRMLELPACGRAKTISLFLPERWWRLRLRPAGLFTELTSLTISCGRMEGTELTALVSTQCPRLRSLTLELALVPRSDFSVRSESLHSLWLFVINACRLEIVAPRLEALVISSHAMSTHISAPKLAKVAWHGDAYDQNLHRFADVGRRLQLLKISRESLVASSHLIQRFDEVDELQLEIHIPKGIEAYKRFLEQTTKLPKSKTFRISVLSDHNGWAKCVLHLLRSCNNTRKFSMLLFERWYPPPTELCPLSCPCHPEEICKVDGIALSSLEEVEISGFIYSCEKEEFVKFLSCNATILKKLVINMIPGPWLTKEVCEQVRSMCHPNVKVEFYVFPCGGRQVVYN